MAEKHVLWVNGEIVWECPQLSIICPQLCHYNDKVPEFTLSRRTVRGAGVGGGE